MECPFVFALGITFKRIKLAAFLQPLNRMGNSRRKVPEIARADIGDKVSSSLIYGGDAA
jgi:hypothetical protein